VWVGGVHYELDCLIFASGFEVGTPRRAGPGFETVRPRRLTLTDALGRGHAQLHGMHVHGFPNLFIVGPSQGANLISNITQNLTEAGTTIATIVNHALALGAEQVEVSREAERRGSRCWRATRVVRRQPRLHARLLQQRGRPMGRKERLGGQRLPRVAARSPTSSYIDEWRTTGEFEASSSAMRPAPRWPRWE
jgi:hypothetical protein